APAVYRPLSVPKVAQTKRNVSRTADARLRSVSQPKSGLNVRTSSRSALNSFKPVVQGYFTIGTKGVLNMAQEAREPGLGKKTFLAAGRKNEANIRPSFNARMRVSNDGKMAIEDSKDRQAKTFYAAPAVVATANNRLKNIGSPIRLATNDRIA